LGAVVRKVLSDGNGDPMKNIFMISFLLLSLIACTPAGPAPAALDTLIPATAAQPTLSPATPTSAASATQPAAASPTSEPSATATIEATAAPTATPGIAVYTDGDGGDIFTSEDNLIHSGATDINFGDHNVFDVSVARRILQRFDLSAIPTNAILSSAKVYYYKANEVPNRDVTVTLYSVSQANGDWREGGEYGGKAKAGDSTWNLKDASGIPWAGSPGLSTSGVDYEPKPIGTFVIPAYAKTGDEYVCELDLTRVAGWLGAANNNYGMLLISNGAADYIGSAENETPAYRPRLVVEYTLANP
jgi:hypothetical protein